MPWKQYVKQQKGNTYKLFNEVSIRICFLFEHLTSLPQQTYQETTFRSRHKDEEGLQDGEAYKYQIAKEHFEYTVKM